jgi:hypothetical protein
MEEKSKFFFYEQLVDTCLRRASPACPKAGEEEKRPGTSAFLSA